MLNDQDIVRVGKCSNTTKGEIAAPVGNMRYGNLIKLGREAFTKVFRVAISKQFLFKIICHAQVTRKQSDYKLTEEVEFVKYLGDIQSQNDNQTRLI